MAGGVTFDVEPKFWDNEGMWVKTVLDRAKAYISLESPDGHGHYAFVDLVVVKLMTDVCIAAGLPEDRIMSSTIQQRIRAAAEAFVSNVTILVHVGGTTNTTDFAQASNDGGTIYFQPAWVCQAERMKFKQPQYSRYVALGVIKALHEFAHCMTPMILKFHLMIARELAEETGTIIPTQLEATPVSIGRRIQVSKGQKRKGDLGCAVEEILTGGYRCYARFTEEEIWDIETLFVYKTNPFNFVPCDIRNELEVQYVTKIASTNNTPSLDDFKLCNDSYGVTEVSTSKKRKMHMFTGVVSSTKSATSLHSHHDEVEGERGDESSDGESDDIEGPDPFNFSERYGVLHGGRTMPLRNK